MNAGRIILKVIRSLVNAGDFIGVGRCSLVIVDKRNKLALRCRC